MKYSILPAMVIVSLLVSCSGPQNDLGRLGMEGKVKSITEHQCEPTSRDGHWVAGEPSAFGHLIIIYDRDGFYKQSINLSMDGDTLGYSSFRREDGDIVEEVLYSANGDFQSRTLFDRVSKEEENFELWEGDQLLSEGVNFFDSKGKILKQVRVVNDREVVFHFVYEKNLLVDNYEEELTGEKIRSQRYDYPEIDKKGNWTVKLVYVGDEKYSPVVVITREIEYY